MKGLNIRLFAHDVYDAAVLRRASMLEAAGANVTTVGFVRGEIRHGLDRANEIILGRTHNARFLHRIWAVLRTAIRIRLVQSQGDTDVIIARNLEMLLLAVVASGGASKRVPVVYECLDIHRLMLGGGIVARLLRALERRLTRRCAGLITSSPAYVEIYFKSINPIDLPVILLENRVYGAPATCTAQPPAAGQPWTIAWNGAIRCAKSMVILDELARLGRGTIRVMIRGRVSYDQIPAFDETVTRNPHIIYGGPYRYPQDLDEIYDGVHFNWTIDMFWEGQNSTWALANRIYEGGRAGVVPIAQRVVETGRFYERLGIGLVLDDLSPTSLLNKLNSMSATEYNSLRAAALDVPPEIWTMDELACRTLAAQLRGLTT